MEVNNYDLAKYESNKDIEILNKYFSTGKEEILNKAIDIYGHSILKYCHNILCDYHEAEDITQEVFIKAYRKRNKFKEGTDLSAWLYRIAYTTCIDALRKRKVTMFIYKDLKDEYESSDNPYMSDELKEALLKISPKDRALIFSRVFDNKDYSELEVIYKVSSQSLRKRYERAKKKLANILRKNNIY